MDIESKHNWAKKVAVAVGGGAAVAGAQAMMRGSEMSSGGLLASTAQVHTAEEVSADDLELLDVECSIVDAPEQETGVTDIQKPPTEVNLDGISFSEAFRTAREAHGGGGGVFLWKGNCYNTYTRDEYETLTDVDMENLYLAYKRLMQGDTNSLMSSLENTIGDGMERDAETDGSNGQDSFPEEEAPDKTENEGYDCEEDSNDEEDFLDESEPDMDEIDFENLYS